MKELTIEEKAKCYDEAVEKIHRFIDGYSRREISKEELEDMFPELKESEDERIRKELVDIIEYFLFWKDKGLTKEKVLAWLEKQKAIDVLDEEEREFADNVDSYRKDMDEAYQKGYNEGVRVTLKKQGEQTDNLTPQEAMDIAVAKCFEQGEQKPTETVKWSQQEENCICQLESLVKEQWRQAEKVHNSVNIKKMSELMFFLKTLNPNKKPQRIISAEAKEAMYDKPAWSEEDEKMKNQLVDFMLSGIDISKAPYGCVAWLKSLKDRVQPKQEWSEEDEKIKKAITEGLEAMKSSFHYISSVKLDDAIIWLKSLRFQKWWKPSDEQLEALDSATENCAYSEYKDCLRELIGQLKKLKE